MNKVKITSVVPKFELANSYISKEPDARRRFLVWRKHFEKPCQDYFDTYYNWATRNKITNYFKNYNKSYNIKQILKNEKHALGALDGIAGKLYKVIKYNDVLPVVVFVGLHQTNGFVDKYKKKYTTFLQMESYNDSHTLDIFIAHELAHNVHLRANSIYYWKGNKSNWYHSLILEGFATYATKLALGASDVDALWGNYLSAEDRKKFMKYCDNNIDFLKHELLKTIDNTKREESRFFGGRMPKNCPYYRTGYYLGLRFVQELSKNCTLHEIMSLKGQKLRQAVLDFLNK